MGCVSYRRQVCHGAEDIRRLADQTGCIVIRVVCQIKFAINRRRKRNNLNALRFAEETRRRHIMGVDAAGQHDFLTARHPAGHDGGFGAGGRAIIHGGVRHIHGGEFGHLGLEFEERLERALGYFRLIGGVGGEKFRALDDHVDRRRDVVLVGAAADEKRSIRGGGVLCGQPREVPFHSELSLMVRQVGDCAAEAGGIGHIGEKLINGGSTNGVEHLGPVVGGQGKITHQVRSSAMSSDRARAVSPSRERKSATPSRSRADLFWLSFETPRRAPMVR